MRNGDNIDYYNNLSEVVLLKQRNNRSKLFRNLTLGSAIVGAGIGAIVGTFVLPVIGTGIGALIGATFCAGPVVFGFGLDGLFLSDPLFKSDPDESRNYMINFRAKSAAKSIFSSVAIGAVFGAFVFPGIGVLIGAAIGLGIGTVITGIIGLATHTSRVNPEVMEAPGDVLLYDSDERGSTEDIFEQLQITRGRADSPNQRSTDSSASATTLFAEAPFEKDIKQQAKLEF